MSRANALGLGVATVLAVATALAQVINYEFFDLRLRAVDPNTHMSIFGAISLLANAVAVTLVISLAFRARNREMVILSVVLVAMFALRVTYPSHLLLLSLPLTGTALVILWRQGRPAAGDNLWIMRVGCALLVVSFAVHALELEPPPDLPAGVLAAFVGGRPGGGAVINGSHAEAIANTDLPTGTWTYLAVTYDGSAVRFYVTQRPVSRTGKTGDITTSTSPLTIGNDPFYGQYFSRPHRRDPRLRQRSRHEPDPARHDNTGRREAGHAVARHSYVQRDPSRGVYVDEDSGRAVVDLVGQRRATAWPRSTTWTATGKYGGALSFNGTSSRVRRSPTRLRFI